MLVDSIRIGDPGMPSGGGSDNASFVCAGVPAFGLGSLSWDYGTYTWHTNRDTFDKVVFPELKNNAVLTAMLVYLASEDPEMVSRTRIYRVRGATVFITCGVGYSFIPVRFGAPPEVALITLRGFGAAEPDSTARPAGADTDSLLQFYQTQDSASRAARADTAVGDSSP